jgi:hypothetical protein
VLLPTHSTRTSRLRGLDGKFHLVTNATDSSFLLAPAQCVRGAFSHLYNICGFPQAYFLLYLLLSIW